MASAPACARILAIDYGTARIGIAISDELNSMAHPRPFEPAKPPARALRRIARLVESEGVGKVLLGLPRNMDGTEGLSARRVRRFAEDLARCIEVPVQMLDERWTTVEAHARLRETGAKQKETRSKIDSASAAILLQSYLDGLATRHDA